MAKNELISVSACEMLLFYIFIRLYYRFLYSLNIPMYCFI